MSKIKSAGYPQSIAVEDAIQFLLQQAQTTGKTESVALDQANNRVLAENLTSSINVPPSDNSAMDGYALRFDDLQHTNRLPVSQRICAGDAPGSLSPGGAARIFTGAPIPAGADVVVMQERCSAEGNHVLINTEIVNGENIRRMGEDIKAGSIILKTGTTLRAQELGLVASVGISTLPVFAAVKVAILSTGDELCEPGTAPKAGQIYNSNRYTLIGLLKSAGCEYIDLGAVEDTLESTRSTLKKAAEQADLIISTGGVSVGEEDHVKAALQSLGELKMWRINMKPGKPLAFGKINSTPFIGLPGNPVSVFVTFLIFALPFIKKMQGRNHQQPVEYQLPANFSWSKPGSRAEFLRSKINRDQNTAQVEIFSHQGSGVLTSTCWADGLTIIPPKKEIQQGDLVRFIPFSEFFS